MVSFVCTKSKKIFVVCTVNQTREVATLFIKELSQNDLIEKDLQSIFFDKQPSCTCLKAE
jgi:hypothetical protein